ncbi:MAG: hypothetical protein Q7S20_10045 [Gemmatimonadaceae bacterium]|nr:hypothetical protein [Gemmatimonadaceae bacterium]
MTDKFRALVHCAAFIVALCIGAASTGRAQAPVPVNLFVADLKYDSGGVQVGAPRKLTGDRGINSQPSFTPGSAFVLFVSRRDGADGQGDIYRINLATGTETRVTATPEMENSPTITPDGKLMVIRWTPATLFREWGPWIYDMSGKPLHGVLPGPDTVGYYVRVDSVTFAMMRPKSRSAIALFDVRRKTMTDYDWQVANLPPQLIPGQRAISYTRIDSTGSNEIRRLDLSTLQTSAIAPAVTGRVVHAWTRSGILMGKGNAVFLRAPGGDTEWKRIAAFDNPELHSVTTYVVSPRGDKLILISPAKPALVTAIRDSLQEGRSMQETIAALRGSSGATTISSWEVSDKSLGDLGGELVAREKAGDAITLLSYAGELLPKSYAVQMGMGMAYRKAGDEARAVESLRRSLALNPRATPAEKRDAELAQQAVDNPGRR